MKAPYIIYTDFESIIEKFDTCIPPTNKSSTTKTEVHKPCGASFAVVRPDGVLTNSFIYRGESCVQEFLTALIQEEQKIREALTKKAPLQMTDEDWRSFHTATNCHIYKKTLFHHNERDEIEFWHPQTGEYCGKVHKYTKAPGSNSSCYSVYLKQTTQDDDGNYIIEKWAPRGKRPEDADEENDCFRCGRPLLRDRFREAVKDHCHITGKFRK